MTLKSFHAICPHHVVLAVVGANPTRCGVGPSWPSHISYRGARTLVAHGLASLVHDPHGVRIEMTDAGRASYRVSSMLLEFILSDDND